MLQKRVWASCEIVKFISYWNIDHVLRIRCGELEVMYVPILISGLTTWYVPLFSFNTYSINRTRRPSANLGWLWFASPCCPNSHINATDVPACLRSQERDGFYGITITIVRYSRKGTIRRFANTWKSIYQQSVELIFQPYLPITAARHD